MRRFVAALTLSLGAAAALGALIEAQAPAQSPAAGQAAGASAESPSWAYGVPPLGSAPAVPAPGGAAPTAAPGGAAPAGAAPGGQGGGQRAGGGAPRQPDTSLKRIPGSTQEFTLAHIRDYFDVGDWFPDDHPPMPNVVVHGRAPHVRGCAMCHMPNGKGRPENAPVAGQPYAYIVQQLHDFKNDLRTNSEPRKTNTLQMIEAAKDMTDDEIKEAATYFSSMKWTPWIKVVEAATVPKTRISGNVFFVIPDGGTEPIGKRIIETPDDGARFELRDPRSGFTAYVPPGSLKKGALLVTNGGGKVTPCGVCHGQDLNGLGPVPGIAGRSPSYVMRQLWDLKQGTRKGTWSPLMQPIVASLTQDEMLSIAAYVASR